MAKEAELREHELSEIIKNKWGAFYYKMTFEDEVFVQAVTLLTLDGRIAVESKGSKNKSDLHIRIARIFHLVSDPSGYRAFLPPAYAHLTDIP